MGYLLEKYNAEYFLRKDVDGNSLPYGVEGIESFLKGELREHDYEILSRINFKGANVIEFGFGRGETIKYIWEQGANSYTGVDFSSAACNIASEFLAKFSISGPKILCSDAVQFARELSSQNDFGVKLPIDVVVMLDFVEHIPRMELKEVLHLLLPALSKNAVIVINTPDFQFDNDVIADGLNVDGVDSSDSFEETKGMHCNRYTLQSLQSFFSELGYLPISRGHYFTLKECNENIWRGDSSYRKSWDEARARGVPLRGDWVAERFEVAYEVEHVARLHQFEEGTLDGISIYVTPSYLEYYNNGEYDEFLIKFIARHNLAGKVIFDLGAFVGVNSMQFARLVGAEGTICAFEPNPYNSDRLKQNISENPELSNRIKVFPFAISDKNGNGTFKVHRNVDDGISSASYMQGAHTTLSEDRLLSLGFSDVNVSMVTLDDFVKNTKYIPACLKIDIEGAEHLALAGAVNTLAQYRPVLLIELHSIYCAVATINILMPLGYTSEFLHIEPDGRCFIGATAANLHGEPPGMFLQSQKSMVDANLIRMELEASNIKLRESMEVNKLLAANLKQQEDRNGMLDSNLKQKVEQIEVLNCNLQKQVERNNSLDVDLKQQMVQNDILKTNLTRYQMFPPIRLARRLRRMLKSNV
ncbi:FkbM family methyltransferase [Rhodoferax sp. BLA1]|uniref:FkbM family methyltransferase n=1 Tax=Rhodoferax sp. BLA1 TaxID=2576062 RepID=UPI0015D21566|nr:FkbM family methyltransferase [Rhodoferax sp. BLA1]